MENVNEATDLKVNKLCARQKVNGNNVLPVECHLEAEYGSIACNFDRQISASRH